MLDLLEAEGERSVEQLAEQFGVSGMTIRRDLQDLAIEGKIIRTHGGAAPAARVSFEFRFLERAGRHAMQKEAIAAAAVSLVSPGQSVLLDSGTTTLAIARQLKSLSSVTVVTTSLPIASELFGLEHVDLILLGGTLRKDAPDLIGAITDANLEMLQADIAFIGADAIGPDGYLYNSSAELGRMLDRMGQASTAAYAVADTSKVGRHKLIRFAHLRDWCGLITDDSLPAEVRRRLEKNGARVLQPRTIKRAHLEKETAR